MSTIPYIYMRVMPRISHDYCDLIHYTGTTTKEELDNEMIRLVAEDIMLYSEEEVFTSFDDYFKTFWNYQDYKFRCRNEIFEILYFDEEWKEWNVNNFKNEIYEKYLLEHKKYFKYDK